METYRNQASQRCFQMGQGYTLLVDIGTQTGLSARERGSIKFVSAAPWLRRIDGTGEPGRMAGGRSQQTSEKPQKWRV